MNDLDLLRAWTSSFLFTADTSSLSPTYSALPSSAALEKRYLSINTEDPELILQADVWLQCVYIASSFFFILSFRGLSKQETSKLGNLYGVLGMLMAIAGTLVSPFVFDSGIWIFFAACIPPAALAVGLSLHVRMTAVPQVVGILNAFGGLAATLESFALFFSPYEVYKQGEMYSRQTRRFTQFQVYQTVFYLVGAIVGMITFTGSLVACLKLSGQISSKPRILPGRVFYTPLLFAGLIGFGAVAGVYGLSDAPLGVVCLSMITLLSALYGVLFVMAIGGADMPVVISVLNSGSGWAGMFAGLTLQNTLMIISGSFVGASGIILSYVMCKAMNRSLYNVMLGGFGDSGRQKTAPVFEGEMTVSSAEEVVELFVSAKRIIIIPGYGMAVSRAQHSVAALANQLISMGVRVRFGVHPVAGRLPGHMNVLLAEANVPYDIVLSLEEINSDFPETDVVVVVGANDTVNPAAQTDGSCAIYGMPVLEVWKAKKTVVLKRSMNVGYAGVDNPLFLYQNNSMLLGDANKSVNALVEGLCRYKNGNLPIKEGGGEETNVNVSTAVTEDNSVAVNFEGESTDSDSVADSINAVFSLGVVSEVITGETIRSCGNLPGGNKGLEKRVAMTPSVAKRLMTRLNIAVMIETGAGLGASYTDENYEAVGCQVVCDKQDIFKLCKVIAKINAPTAEEIGLLGFPSEQTIICGFTSPSSSPPFIEVACKSGVTLISMDVMPRTSKAQKVDVLSSTAKLAGYRAVLEAFYHYQRLVGPEITAAGKYPPAKILVIGAGVAGLQAVGDAHRMGADVRGFDIRLECKDQVESMGGKYLVIDFGQGGSGANDGGYAKPTSPEFIAKEMALLKQQAKECDIIITTAAIPGRRAPLLLKTEHVNLMKRGSVVVDMAASSGGNCEVTRPGEVFVFNEKVTVVGFTDLPSRMAPHASDMFACNIYHLLEHCGGGSSFNIHMSDDIIRAITVTHNYQITYPPPPIPLLNSAFAGEPRSSALEHDMLAQLATAQMTAQKHGLITSLMHKRFIDVFTLRDVFVVILIGLITALFSTTSPPSFPSLILVFVLGCWVGYLLIWNVAPALHTPLMSVSNAISGVVLVGGMLGVSPYAHEDLAKLPACGYGQTGAIPFYCRERGNASVILNAIAIAVASMNVFGGFAVTHRMLRMFKKSCS